MLRGIIQVEMYRPITRVITEMRMGDRMVAARFSIREMRQRADEAANSGEELQWCVKGRQSPGMRTQ